LADIAGDLSTTATLGVGTTTGGSLEVVGDHDWYAVTLTAGQQVVVTVNGVTLDDPYLNIRDSAGNILFSNDDISTGVNRDSKVAFAAPTSGTYYIDVGAWNDGSAGSYQVAIKPYTPPPLATNDQIANQLSSGFWGGDSHHFAVTQGGSISVNISTLTAAEQNLARTALSEWTDIIGVRFQEVTTGGQIVFSDAEGADGSIAATDASWSRGITTSAHVQISSSWVTRYGSGLYSYSLQTYVHEIGHALGLGHAGDYNNSATYPYDSLFQNDAWSTSIMSYFSPSENTYFAGQGFTDNFVLTPMSADILAMQTLYGLSTTTRTGDTTYGFNSNAGGVFNASLYPRAAYTIFDNGGTDTIDFSGSAANQLLNLNPETFSNTNGRVGNLTIARNVVIENAIGGSGRDTIVGNGADNVLKGGSGADTLTGGGGSDTFADTAAGHNGDSITDFGAADRIVFTDATAGSFTFSLSGNTLNFSGGSLVLSNLPAGRVVMFAAAAGGVQLAVRHVDNDFNGDGRSDILWRDDNGALADWLATGSGGFGSGAGTSVGLDWKVAGTGDFNGDGREDILWRNDNGTLTDWLGASNGAFIDNGALVKVGVSLDWHVVGVADFNGDGRDDILWRNDSGVLANWLATASGGFVSNASASVGLQWKVAGTGDFNGDGFGDVLWRNDSGQLNDWLGTANGGWVDNGANAASFVGNDWHIVGTGDFNGDGRSDILWRNDSGALADWLATPNGGFVANFGVNVPLDWKVAGTGDYNGDGRDDILWRNDSGQVGEWLGTTSGSFVDNGANAATFVATSWHVQDPFL
jgi:hypothetical protein